MNRALPLLAVWAFAACRDYGRGTRDLDAAASQDSTVPVLLNEELPFRYPRAVWAQRIQGNVTLRLFIDTLGMPVADSTRIASSSGIAALDTAALDGVPALRFRAALHRGRPVAAVLLLPVFFRHPDAPPLPGDTSLRPTQPPPLPQ